MGAFQSKSQGPEVLAHLHDQIEFVLEKLLGLEAETRTKVALAICDQMALDWGGQNLYFPKGCSMKLRPRDEQIYREFTGNNIPELVHKYELSTQWIYRIIKIKTEDAKRRQQPDLFEAANDDNITDK